MPTAPDNAFTFEVAEFADWRKKHADCSINTMRSERHRGCFFICQAHNEVYFVDDLSMALSECNLSEKK